MSKLLKIRVGFTGTKNGMDDLQKISLGVIFSGLRDEYQIVEFHHGDCIGADAQAAKIAKQFGFYLICHPGYPPKNPKETKYRAFTDFNDEVLEPKPFIERDRDIVDVTDKLIAAPVSQQEETRSGTWTTIRYAKKRGKTITILNPKKVKRFDPHSL